MHALIGKVADFGILEVIQFVAQTHKTGRLTVEQGELSAGILLHEGTILRAWRNEGRPIGAYLIDRGVLDEVGLRAALEAQRADPMRPPLGHVLLACGWVTAHQLQATLALQVQEVLHVVMSWKLAIFSFDIEPLTPDDSFALTTSINLQTQQILLEVIRVRDEVEQFLAPSSRRPNLTEHTSSPSSRRGKLGNVDEPWSEL